MSGSILGFHDIRANVDVRCDVCIVGSGAGGAVLAAGLVERGLSVVMLEEGSHFTRADFNGEESWALPNLYQERGGRATVDRSITVLQGRTVGGSTTVNWTTCFRTPERILEHWKSVHGVEGYDIESLRPHFEAVEARLNIAEWPEMMANANNKTLLRGCRELGWETASIRRNVDGCVNSGYCGMGCPVDGKSAMHVTYLHDAVKRGLTIYANTRAVRLEVEGRRVVAVKARTIHPDRSVADGHRVTVRPKVLVSSGGAINGPALLLRSGVHAGGRVGRRTFLHPVVLMTGLYEEAINGWYGAPQSISSHEHIDRGPDKLGFFLEAAPVHPMLSAISLLMIGDALREEMGRLQNVSALIALSVDGLHPGEEGGTISLRPGGRIGLDYPITDLHKESFRACFEALARVHLAAGALEAHTGHIDRVTIRSEADLARLDDATYGAHEHTIFTAHQMGGCQMGGDPATSVVDADLRFRGIPNLFVVDGSVLPTSLGVNPSLTIYGIAHKARDAVASAV